MSHPSDSPSPDLSRRTLIGALTAAGAFGAVAATGVAGPVHAAAPGDQTEALDPTVSGLVYVPIDAFAFDTAQAAATPYRLYQQVTGMQPSSAPGYVQASLPIPIGSVVKQINVSFQGQPIVSIDRRNFADAAFTPITDLFFGAAGGGVKTASFTTSADISHGASYAVRVFCSAGDSTRATRGSRSSGRTRSG
jgi:hypothetical protein